MRNIRLVDGTVYQVNICGAADGQLSIRIADTSLSLLDVIPAFGDPDNVVQIEHYFDGTGIDHIIFSGFTVLIAANLTPSGVHITLREETAGGGTIEPYENGGNT